MPLYNEISSLIIQYSDHTIDTDKFVDGFVPLMMKAEKSEIAASTLVSSITGAYSEFVEELIGEEEFRRRLKQLLPPIIANPVTFEFLTTLSPPVANYNKPADFEGSSPASPAVKICFAH